MKDTLKRLSVFVDDERQPVMTLGEAQTAHGINRMLQTVRDITDAPTDAVAASVFFRRIGFLISSSIQYDCGTQASFCRTFKPIGIIQDDYTFKFIVPSEGYIEVQDEEQALRFVLDTYGHPLVEFFSQHAKIPKLILWENIWGYVIWVYSQLNSGWC